MGVGGGNRRRHLRKEFGTNMRRSFLRALTAFGVIIFSHCASGQDTRGTILGRVTDPTGALISRAEIRAKNTETGVAAEAVTNDAGNFRLPYLISGTYSVQVEVKGFKKSVRDGIEVRIGDAVELNIQMQLGSATESVEVTADTPLLSTAESSLGQVVNQRRIVDLPSFGGSPITLVLTAPGAINSTDMRQSDRASTNVNSSFSTDGAGVYNNEFAIDGVPNTIADTQGNSSSSRVAFIPPQTAISEFKVQTAPFDASIGHTGGSLITVSTKSGTNELHGEAHWVVRNRIFDAPKIFQNSSGQKVPVYQNNRYGLSAGAPVYLPRLYNGKNKTFWFYAWEEMRHGIPQTWITSVPTAAERRGDFSALLGLGPNYQLYDPRTTAAAEGGRFSRQPIPGNIIPTSRLDPVSQKLVNYWPLPNQPGNREGLNNWNYSEPTKTRSWVHMGRVDHAFSPNHRAYVRLNQDDWNSMEGRMFGNVARGYDQSRKNQGIALDDVYVFSPSLLLNIRYGLTYQKWTERRLSVGTDLASLGFSPQFVGMIDKNVATLPRVEVGTFASLGNWATGDGVGSALTHSLSGNFTKTQGNHSSRYGVDFRAYRQNRNQNPTEISPTLTFATTYTRGPLDSSPAPTIGGEFAAFLLGVPGGSMDRVSSAAEQDKYIGLYFQDDWKLTSKLTLNLGLRYEYESPVTERFNRSVAHFAFGQSSPIEAATRANYAASPIPELPADQFRVRGGLTFANAGGTPRAYWDAEKKNFMPRIGLAWQINPKTVARAGYGTFYSSVGVNNTASIQTGFSQTTPIQPSLDSGLTFIATTANPFPNGLIAPLGASGGLSTNLGQSISFFPTYRKHPYGQRWSAGVQRVLPGQLLIEATYVGNRGTRINISRELNATPEQYLSRSGVRDAKTIDYLSAALPNPFYGTNPIYGKNTSRSSLLKPFPQFGSITAIEPVGYSWYHALQLRAERRFSQGYTFQLAYTYSKTMQATEFLNPSDTAPYRSLSDMDRTHRLVVTGIWELPVGRGKRFGASIPSVAQFFIGGWQLNTMMQRQSGPPLAFGDIWTLFNGNPDSIVLPKDKRSVDRWFNTDAGFNRNSAQQLSSNIRVSPIRFGGIRGDGQARWDFSAFKSFEVKEQIRMQFRAECLNAWNHPNLSTPVTTPTSSTFGTITSQDVPRIWQMSLKLVF